MSQGDSNLTGIQLNCQSLNSKLTDIKLMVNTHKPDFVALTETWLQKHPPKFSGYSAINKNRIGARGGGLCFLIKLGVQYSEIPLTPVRNGVLEMQAIRIHLKNSEPLSILNVYNPHHNNSFEAELKDYISQLNKKFIIIGDFNAHSPMLDSKVLNADPSGKVIENLIMKDDLCLINPINFYTHLNTANMTRSCLDLTLSSSSDRPVYRYRLILSIFTYRPDPIPKNKFIFFTDPTRYRKQTYFALPTRPDTEIG